MGAHLPPKRNSQKARTQSRSKHQILGVNRLFPWDALGKFSAAKNFGGHFLDGAGVSIMAFSHGCTPHSRNDEATFFYAERRDIVDLTRIPGAKTTLALPQPFWCACAAIEPNSHHLDLTCKVVSTRLTVHVDNNNRLGGARFHCARIRFDPIFITVLVGSGQRIGM